MFRERRTLFMPPPGLCCEDEIQVDPRTLPPWPVSVSLAVVGLLVLACVPLVSGQREFRVTENTSPYKGYSGIQPRPDAERLIYYHEQTIAVVEVGPKRELFNCELIEVYRPGEMKTALRNMSEFAKPYRLEFDEMINLMSLCGKLSPPLLDNELPTNHSPGSRALATVNPVTLLSGILPGTKCCGARDLADNYFDLGVEAMLDKCCRTHDLCPVKVRAYTSRYNLTNNSLYTKSHCTWDAILLQCLKDGQHSTADIMRNIHFNLLKVPCVRQGKDRTTFHPAERHYNPIIRG
ncbi:hypothetical protein J6590_089122 [Homalodisca vitripennis]|nr:hypothetical protein J6590_089122 [Homalodisca vitripennis]